MTGKFDIRQYSIPLMLIAIALYISAFYIPYDPFKINCFLFEDLFNNSAFSGRNALSIISATVLLLGTAFSIYLFDSFFSTGINHIIAAAYLCFTLSSPYSIILTPVHITGLLLVWSIFYSIKYIGKGQNNDLIFISMFLLGCASFFYVPIIWIFPIIIGISIRASEDKTRYLITTLIGLIMPLVFLEAAILIFYGSEAAVASAEKYWQFATCINSSFPKLSAATTFSISVVTIISIIASFGLLKIVNRFSVIMSRTIIRLITYMVSLAIIGILFMNQAYTLFGILIFVPTTVILFEYLDEKATKKSGNIIALFLLIIIIFERVSFFIK